MKSSDVTLGGSDVTGDYGKCHQQEMNEDEGGGGGNSGMMVMVTAL